MGLNLALDKCWISAQPDDLRPRAGGDGELLLVDRGCPAARGVEVSSVNYREPDSTGEHIFICHSLTCVLSPQVEWSNVDCGQIIPDDFHPASAFQVFGGPSERPGLAFSVTESMARMQRVYIFCLVGMCSPSEAFARGNLNLVSNLHCSMFGNCCVPRCSCSPTPFSVRGLEPALRPRFGVGPEPGGAPNPGGAAADPAGPSRRPQAPRLLPRRRLRSVCQGWVIQKYRYFCPKDL